MESLHVIILAVLAILWVYVMVQKWRKESIEENSSKLDTLPDFDFPPLTIVAFDKDSCPADIYKKYYEKDYEGKTFFWLGNIPNMPGHCIILDSPTGKYFVAHSDNFRVATDDEI